MGAERIRINTFDWDRYLEVTPYNAVLKSVGIYRKVIPSMFSPDGKHLYLKSHDVAVDVDDVDMLKSLLLHTYAGLVLEIQIFKFSVEGIHLHEIDLCILMDVLHAQGKLPEEFGGEDYIPEKYLKKAWEEAGRLTDQASTC